MNNIKYCKKINIKPWDVYYKQNKETWEIEYIEPIKQYWPKFITPIIKFMKVFTEWNIQTIIFKIIWEYYKYIGVLLDCTWYDNVINMAKFRKTINITDPAFSKLKFKLKELNIFKEIEWEFFLNPIIWIKSEKISKELWDLFKKSNKELFWIEVI